MHIIPSFDMVGFTFMSFGPVLFLSALLWVAYIALEPAVRARWPHSLITWNRLMNGEFGDPRVGSHILAGITLAMALLGFFGWRSWLLANRGAPPGAGNVETLMGARPFLAAQFLTVGQAILSGTAIFFVVCGIRFLARRDWAAAALGSALLIFGEGTIRNSSNLAVDIPLYVTVFFALMYMLVRMGLLPSVVALFSINTIGRVSFGREFSSWQNPFAVMHLLIVASLAIFAFWRSQSRPRERTAAIRL
jgi:serine/threonine-protein kinase